MSSYWKSLPRHFCKYCNYWCVDNKNVQNHENSEQHKTNVEKFMMRQKTEKDRKASQEKEVLRVIREAEEKARESMHSGSSGMTKGGKSVTTQKRSLKKKPYQSDMEPYVPFIPYDTVQTTNYYGGYNQSAIGGSFTPQPMNMGAIPPPPPLLESIPPPPLPESIEPTVVDEADKPDKPEIKYNFNYKETINEEDLFGSWSTVSVSTVTADELKKRDEQYERALYKCDKNKANSLKVEESVIDQAREVEMDDEDEQDAFDVYNPFGGKYKGLDISSAEPMFIPEGKKRRQSEKKEDPVPNSVIEEEKKEQPPEETQFISTPIQFSFQPQANPQKEEAKPVSSSVASFFG